jgi:pentatricopeptide repeat domain-containing protein 1
LFCLSRTPPAQIFDWLRGLDDSHDLYPLCNTMTYTTMISQCGTQQQLRRALELVAEMRSRGIQCNVHTYSALMNVCIKGERNAAGLGQLWCCIRLTCTHSARCRGSFEKLVLSAEFLKVRSNVMCSMHAHSHCAPLGCPHSACWHPYLDLLLAACPVCCAAPAGNELDLALDVYRQMLQEGCTPNLVTFNTLIDVYGKTGAWEEAIRVLDALEQQGIDPEIRTYNTGACVGLLRPPPVCVCMCWVALVLLVGWQRLCLVGCDL